MSESRRADADRLPPAELADHLKERVYITFSALGVVLALHSHGEEAREAAVTLLVTVIGTLLAVFVADLVSHIAAHATLPDHSQVRYMLRVSFGALAALVIPFVFVGLAVADVWPIDRALRGASIALVVALVAIGFVAIRRVRLPRWQRLVVLFAEFVLGFAVVGLERLAHG